MRHETTPPKTRQARTARQRGGALLAALALLTIGPASPLLTTRALAQDQGGAPPKLSASQLDKIVAPIALYPDPLLAQVLAASTFPDQVPSAYKWANDHANLKGDALTNAMQSGDLPFDPSLQALVPFPSVLKLMNGDIDWTAQLGNAVLSQRGDVMDAVQRMRKEAYDKGNLKTTQQQKVEVQGESSSQTIVIQPSNPQVVYVPTYNPQVVYTQPPPADNSKAVAAGFLGFVTGVALTAAFTNSCWGWNSGCNWHNNTVVINNGAWGRTWTNRGSYAHSSSGWNSSYYSRPNSYANRPTNTTINNVNVNRNTNYSRNVNNRNTNVSNNNRNNNVGNNNVGNKSVSNNNRNNNVGNNNRNNNVGNNNVGNNNRNNNVGNNNVGNNNVGNNNVGNKSVGNKSVGNNNVGNNNRNNNVGNKSVGNKSVGNNNVGNNSRGGNSGGAQTRPANTNQSYNRGGNPGGAQNAGGSRGYTGSTPSGGAFSGVSSGSSAQAAGARGRSSTGGGGRTR